MGTSDIGGHTSGRNTDIGGSHSGGDASDLQFGGQETHSGKNPISKEEAQQADTEQLHGTPDDLKPGKRRTVGVDENAGAGDGDVSGIPGSTGGET